MGGCDHVDRVVGDPNLLTRTDAAVRSIRELGARTVGEAGLDLEAERSHAVHETLNPGVYCGGLTVAPNAFVTLNPGVYVMKNGPLFVELGGRLEGDGVGFYLTGTDAVFLFSADSKISLGAPTTGPLAGLLFFEDRAAPLGRRHAIFSDDARRLLGTFYLPRGELAVSTIFPVADQSDYTAIIAQKLTLFGGPMLTLNTDYHLSSVPTPEGVGAVGGRVFLRE
ncbi:MAG: hypothetical protein ACFB00_04510 [Parvularculaceae bacterium]